MSGEAVGWAFRKVSMDDATAKFVLVAICNYANENDEAWPSHASIARLTGLSKRSIQNGIKKLEDWGIITRERRDRDNGSETSAKVLINLEVSWIVKGGIATPAIGGVWQEVPQGVAPHATLETTLKPQSKNLRSAKADSPYSDDFETLWQLYPRTRNTSKKDAWNVYRMLNDDRREQVRRAVPIFAAAMRAEGRPEDKIKHMVSWLNGKMYETASAPAGAPRPAGAEPEKPWYQTATRETWVRLLLIYSSTNNWSPKWGPDLDKPGCAVPPDLIEAFNREHRSWMFEDRSKRKRPGDPAAPPQ